MELQYRAMCGMHILTSKLSKLCPTILKSTRVMPLQEFVKAGDPVRKVNIMVMEYLKNGSLYQFMLHRGRKGRLLERHVRRFFRDIVQALDVLHSNGFAHLDIKHLNIMISNECHAMLIDFGMLESCEKDLFILKGTPEWRDPSQVEG